MFWYRITEEKDIHGKGVCPFLVAMYSKEAASCSSCR